MRRYQTMYAEFFEAYARSITDGDDPLMAESRKLLPMMKLELARLRVAILKYPQRTEWLRHEALMREAQGDTRYLRRLDFNLI
jgi:hypothetical protein